MIHKLKIQRPFADAIISGDKNFEIRENDRGFQKGDTIKFICMDGLITAAYHIINDAEYEITYVLSGWGLEDSFVALGIKLKEQGGDANDK